MWIKHLKKPVRKVLVKLSGLVLRCKIAWKRKRYDRLVFLISTAYWGNVGDHAIVLGEKKIISDAGMGKQIVELDSVQYSQLKHIVKKLVIDNDIIIIDGGGNFGDVWPETQLAINDIIRSYKENKIIVFPESWYFTESDNGQNLLANTVEVIDHHSNMVIYARDSYSYNMMKKYLPRSDVRQSFDMVFFLDRFQVEKKESGIALVIREDREAISEKFTKTVLEKSFYDCGRSTFEIKNDCYHHISKEKRKRYVQTIVQEYMKAEVVITDRFHGMVLSILCKKPCVIIDNKTGKVGHSYKDMKEDLEGILYVDNETASMEEIVAFVKGRPTLSVSQAFLDRLDANKKELIKEITR